MEKDELRILLSRLDKRGFEQFIYKLLKSHYKDSFHKDNNFNSDDEQVFWKSDFGHSRKAFYVTNTTPFEVFKNFNHDIIDSSSLPHTLQKLNQLYDKSIPYYGKQIERIYFLTNYNGYKKDEYELYISDAFEMLATKCGLKNIGIGIGSIDSFIDLQFDNTLNIFKKMLLDNNSGVAITIGADSINVNNFNEEKYVNSGVTIGKKDLLQPIFLQAKTEKDILLKEFEQLLNNKAKEDELEKFLTKYYRDIFGEHYFDVKTQIWLKFPHLDINDKNRRLDIFLRNGVSEDWELFEIKRANEITKITSRDIPMFKAEVYEAIEQARNYRRILLQDEVRKILYNEGIEYYEPVVSIIIGSNPTLPKSQWRRMVDQNSNDLNIMTYTDLLKEMQIRLDTRAKIIEDVMLDPKKIILK
jgi:hypothetical protein